MKELYSFHSDILATSLILIYVLFWIMVTEVIARRAIWEKADARKLLHIMVGNVLFFVPLFENWLFAVGVPALFIVGNYLMSPLSPIEKLRMSTFDAGHAYGTIFYAVSMTVTIALFFRSYYLLVLIFFPLTYGDGLAAVTGVRAKSGHYQLSGGKKSYLGTATMFVASLLAVYLGLIVFGVNSFPLAFSTALIATVLEAIAPKGTDNLVIPLGLTLSVLLLGW